MVAIFLFLTTFCILKMAGYTDEATKNPKTKGNKIPYKQKMEILNPIINNITKITLLYFLNIQKSLID